MALQGGQPVGLDRMATCRSIRPHHAGALTRRRQVGRNVDLRSQLLVALTGIVLEQIQQLQICFVWCK